MRNIQEMLQTRILKKQVFQQPIAIFSSNNKQHFPQNLFYNFSMFKPSKFFATKKARIPTANTVSNTSLFINV
jgi:hypothetical protein